MDVRKEYALEFSSVITVIFANSSMTMQSMANYIGYDTSYISKWKNGKSLPSVKSSDIVAHKICEFVFSECSEHEIANIFRSLHERAPENKEVGYIQLNDILMRCLLKNAVNFDTLQVQKPTPKSDCAIYSASNFSNTVLKEYTLEDTTNAASPDSHIMVALQPQVYNDYFSTRWNDIIFGNEGYGSKKVVVLWKSLGGRSSLSMFKMVISMLDSNRFSDLSFYEIPPHHLGNVVVSKDRFLLAVNPDIDSGLGSVIVSNDKALINRTHESLLSFCRINYSSVSQITQKTYIDERYDLDMSLHGRQKQLLSLMYPLFMSDEILDDVISELSLSESWKSFQHRSNSCPKTVLIYKSALTNYAHHGTIVLNYMEVSVSREIRKKHLRYLVDKMLNTDSLDLIVLDDTNPVIPIGHSRVSYLNNSNHMYAIRRSTEPNQAKIYIFRSKDLITNFSKTYESLLADCVVFQKYCLQGSDAVQYLMQLIDTIS